MAYFSLLSQRIDNEKNLKLQKGVEQSKLYLELTKEWDGPRRSRRKRLVATILDHEGTSNDYDELSSRFEAVIDFFEDIGLFLKRGYLDEDVVWHGFSEDTLGYRSATEPFVSALRARRSDPTYYEGLELSSEK